MKGVYIRVSKKIRVTCSTCKKIVLVKPSRAITFKTCSRKCFGVFTTGHRPFHYKGGRLVHKGYVYLLAKGHPNGDRDGYVTEHRLVMERSIGRYLDRKEVVHHINHVRSDNRLENLALLESQSAHMKEHKFGQHHKKL